MNWLSQYIMPKSVTWWIGIFLILTGVTLNLFGLFGVETSPILDLLNFVWQNVPNGVTGLPMPTAGNSIPPNAYVVAGLALIGLRKGMSAPPPPQ